jgi:hypothetical protein
MPNFVCVYDNVYFNHKVWSQGEVITVDDTDLIEKMGARFVPQSDYENSLRKVTVNLDRKRESFTRQQVEDITKEVAAENARLRNELKETKRSKIKVEK